MRLGMRLIKGISSTNVGGIERARGEGPFRSIRDLVRRSGVQPVVLTRLAAADAFRSMGLNRREALWQALAVPNEELPLFDGMDPDEGRPPLPEASLDEQVIMDYDSVGLSLEAHPISLVRDRLNKMNVAPAERLKRMRKGQPVRVAGLVLVRQRPSTASGVVFVTLEDETGIANLIIRPKVYERCRRATHNTVALIADGRLQRQGEVIHIQTSHLRELAEGLAAIRSRSRDFH